MAGRRPYSVPIRLSALGQRFPRGSERVDGTGGRLGPAEAQDLLRQPPTSVRLYSRPGGLQGTQGIGDGPLALPTQRRMEWGSLSARIPEPETSWVLVSTRFTGRSMLSAIGGG